MGLVSITLVVAVQTAIEPARRGVATSGVLFFRNIGATLGVARHGREPHGAARRPAVRPRGGRAALAAGPRARARGGDRLRLLARGRRDGADARSRPASCRTARRGPPRPPPPGRRSAEHGPELRIDLGRLRRDIEALATIGRDPTGGISRPAWSPAHEEARAWLLGRLRAAGLAARVDPAGNVFGRLGEGTPVGPDGLPHRHGAARRAARRRARRAGRPRVSPDGRGVGRPAGAAARGGRVHRRGGALLRILRLPRADGVASTAILAERLADPTGLPLPEAMRRAGFDLAAGARRRAATPGRSPRTSSSTSSRGPGSRPRTCRSASSRASSGSAASA